ncbi:hypothetical protein [Thermoflavimicrobium daqui]|uniref:Lipoprotein n=1 Tax=Thermoflavimicrobium daqui TaxID=2137476 RepID=A0A364K910_9BACL|nr:hypothetical protein [Thermoflavimicrobium daqui]RAL26786.1 hypothetical protein DL897_01660 [Thermoflavimicrobium daqui]
MKKKLVVLSTFALSMLLFSGCGLLLPGGKNQPQEQNTQGDYQQQNENNNNNSVNQNNDTTNNNSQTVGVAAKQQGEEIGFRADKYGPTNSSHPPSSTPGIRVHTKDKHAGSIESYIKYSWDREDYIEVQVGNEDLKGKKLDVIRVEKKGPDLINIVVKPSDPSFSTPEDKDLPARGYFRVDKGKIDPNKVKFSVTTEDGKALKLQ